MKDSIRRLYWRVGLDLFKPWSVVCAVSKIWNRPFDHLQLHGVGAEIGVFRGMHAAYMLRRHKGIEQLIMVDAYAPYPGIMPLLTEAEKDAHRRLDKFGSRVRWLKESSPACVAKLPPLDFCYIDGEHTYDGAKKDIEAVWPKIKPDGTMGGHDFSPGFTGVIRAVTEFAVSMEIQLYVHTPDWWIIKTNKARVEGKV